MKLRAEVEEPSAVDFLNRPVTDEKGASRQAADLELRIINARKRGVSDEGAIELSRQLPLLDEAQSAYDDLHKGKSGGRVAGANRALDGMGID